MRHPSVRELYEHWNALRGARAAPDRAEIEPGAIRRVLADTFVLAFDARVGHPFRIAGTRVCAAFGRELKGMPFVSLWNRQNHTHVRELLAVVAQETVGAIAGARGMTEDGSELDFELLVLPLRHRDRTDARIIGALAPMEAPYWFGVSTLSRLSLGTIRYLRPESGASAAPGPRLVSQAPAVTGRRHGFVVYDGGRR
jgi:hypothetical protein